jgi:hypothetical protein
MVVQRCAKPPGAQRPCAFDSHRLRFETMKQEL